MHYSFEKKSLFANDRLRVSVTDTCNLRCTYCSNEGQHHNRKNYLDFCWYACFLDKLAAENIYIRKLNITGGEPLLHPRLVEILAASIQVADEVTLNTNGLLLGRDKIDRFASMGLKNIKFGVDWIFGEAIKPSKTKAKYNRDDYIDNIRHAVDVMPRSSLNVVMSEFNVDRIEMMIDFVVSERIDKVEFLEVITHDFRDNKKPEKRVLWAESIVERIKDRFTRIEYNERLAKYMCFLDDGFMVQFAEDFCNRRVCQNLWTRMDSSGRISPCIKSIDAYQIDIGKKLFGQLKDMNSLMCNNGIGWFPRNNVGKLGANHNLYQESFANNRDYPHNDFVIFSDRDP